MEMSRSTVYAGLVGVAWNDGDHDKPQRVDRLLVLIDIADGLLSVADAKRPRGSQLRVRLTNTILPAIIEE